MNTQRFTFGAYLRAYFAIVKGGPVKYIRRVPTGNPKRPWRYIYSETGTAHAAKEGERINLRHRGAHDVVEVRGDKAKLRDAETGAERTVSLEALHEEIHSIYGAKAERGAARLAAQIVRAAGAPPDGAFKSVKSAWAAYAKRFKAAGVDEGHAKRLVGFLAKRDGWGDDAKAVLLSLATGKKHGAKIAASGRQIAQGAENLRAAEGAKKVAGAHVVRAVASRLPKGDGDAGQRVEELRAGASGALGKLEGILDAIDAVGESAPKALLDKAMVAAGSEHIQALNDAVKAYPGLHDLPEVAKLHELRGRLTALQEPDAGQDGGKGARGAYATVYIAGPDGAPMPQAARYRLIESEDVIASHDPTKGFAQRPEYPEGVQERVYHRDKAEQAKVLGNADKLRPDIVVNTNPDAVNGPPVITADGIVLGGNSRAMTLQLVHAKGGDTAKAYKDELRKKAAHFGLAAADIDGMKSPVLVREVQTDAASKEDLGVLVRRYNESFTQAMDPRTDQVARARLVTPKMLQDLASGMDQRKADGSERYPTLNAFLESNDARGFVDAMQRAGIIDRRNQSQYLRKDGGLNEDGKTFVERLMVGKVVPHPDTLADMPVSQINAIARSVPHIVRAADSGHDLGPALIEAVQTHVYMRRHNLGDLREFDADQTLGDFAGDGGAGFGEKPKLTPLGRSLLGVLIDKPGPVQMSDAFRKVAQHASRNPAGQGGMFGPAKTTAELVEEAVNPPKVEQASMFASTGPRFGAFLASALGITKSGGPFIGPRGGKWADARHTIPWKDNTPKRAQAAADEKTREGRGGMVSASSVPDWRERLTAVGVDRPVPANVDAASVQIDVSGDPHSHVVARWKDQRGVEHKAYTQEFHARNAARKWERVKRLDRKFDAGMSKLEDELANAGPDDPKGRGVAALYVIAKTGLRPGNPTSASDRERYGVLTLTPEHVSISGDTVSFKFVGKSGKTNVAQVKSAALAKFVQARATSAPDRPVFDPSGGGDTVKAAMAGVGWEGFLRKDLRTHTATRLAAAHLAAASADGWPGPEQKRTAAMRGVLKSMYAAVAERLNNTPAVARAAYVSPAVVMAWATHAGVDPSAIMKGELTAEALWRAALGIRLPGADAPLTEPTDDEEDAMLDDLDDDGIAKAIQQDMFGQHVRVDTSHKPTQHGLDFGEPTRPKPASDTHPGGTGWQPMPGSKHGGYRRRHGNHWETWYPKAAHHAYPHGGKAKPGAMVRAPDGHLHVVKRVLQHGKTGEMMVGVDTPRGPKEWPASAVKVHREAHEVGGTLGLDKVPQIQLRAGGNFGRFLRQVAW